MQTGSLLTYVCLALSLSACAAGSTPAGGPDAVAATPFTHRVSTTHVSLVWNCTEGAGGALRMDGMAVNAWQMHPIRFLEFELVGVDARERTVSAAKGEAAAIQLFTNESTPFQLVLQRTGAEARVDLYYQYRAFEDGHSRPLASADPRIPFRVAQAVQRFFVRDACSPSQHLL
jgi:hypothetical protein